jgi:hypothetical protein
MDAELYRVHRELFPERTWPGEEEAARELAGEIRALRLLAEILVTSILTRRKETSIR